MSPVLTRSKGDKRDGTVVAALQNEVISLLSFRSGMQLQL